MSKYVTQQRKDIIDLLSERNQLLSAKEIHSLINKKNKNIGLTTIYRYLNYLELENKI